MPSSSSPTRSSCSRSSRRGGPARLLCVLAAALALAGCGDDDEPSVAAPVGGAPDPSGTLRLAVPGAMETIDPLLASSPLERLASRQVYEPLVTRQAGPFGLTRLRPGLVRSFEPSAGATLWTATLRRGVRFGNGQPLDADAVLANVERWTSVDPGPELLPELSVAFSPRPGIVSFQLDRPSARFPRRLASARLAIVAPGPLAGLGAAPLPLGGAPSGTGAFDLRERDGTRTLLARNPTWWGSPLGLGPGVDQIELLNAPDGADLLLGGAVDVVAELGPAEARRVAADPLLTVVRRGGILGMERSVRGIESARVDQPLADAWITDLQP